jgi:hypothetical protein
MVKDESTMLITDGRFVGRTVRSSGGQAPAWGQL